MKAAPGRVRLPAVRRRLSSLPLGRRTWQRVGRVIPTPYHNDDSDHPTNISRPLLSSLGVCGGF